MGGVRTLKTFFKSELTDNQILTKANNCKSSGIDLFGFTSERSACSYEESDANNFKSSEIEQVNFESYGGKASTNRGAFCDATKDDTTAVMIEQELYPIYDLFDYIAIETVGRNRMKKLKLRMGDIFSYALFPTKEFNNKKGFLEKQFCECYKQVGNDPTRIKCGDSRNGRDSASQCDRTCKKLNVPACHGGNLEYRGNNKVDSVFGEIETCHERPNYACTWDNSEKTPDCYNNCIEWIDETTEPFTNGFTECFDNTYAVQRGNPCEWDDDAFCTYNTCTNSLDCSSNCLCTLDGDVDGLGGAIVRPYDKTTDRETECKSPITYGGLYYLQVVVGDETLKRWLTASRRSNKAKDKPKNGYGHFVWTEDGAHDRSENPYTYDAGQFQWIIRSQPAGPENVDDDRNVVNPGPDEDTCVKYGDIIYLQGAAEAEPGHWLFGVYNKDTVEMTTNFASEGATWIVRSHRGTGNDNRLGDCVLRKDHLYLENGRPNADGVPLFLDGARGTGNVRVYQRATGGNNRFEIRSTVDLLGRTTNFGG